MAFKPMKMGLRIANLCQDKWEMFLEAYMRVQTTFEQLYNIKLTQEEIKIDLDYLK